MHRRLLSLTLLAITVALSSCISIKDAPAGAFAVGPHYGVTLGRQWSDISELWPNRPSSARLLTIDGPSLNRLYVTDGIAPGGWLIQPVRNATRTPTYRADMSPTELVEFVTDSVAGFDFLRVETQNLRPARFAGSDALRFDLTAATRPGLEMRGTALVAEHEGRLYLILYLAPSEHYYSATLQEVEGIMSSVRVGQLDLRPYARAEALALHSASGTVAAINPPPRTRSGSSGA